MRGLCWGWNSQVADELGAVSVGGNAVQISRNSFC